MRGDLSLEDVDGPARSIRHGAVQALARKLQRELAAISGQASRRAQVAISTDHMTAGTPSAGLFEKGCRRLLRSLHPTKGLPPSSRRTMPDTGGRSFHFEVVSVRPDSCRLKKGQRLQGNQKVGKSKFAKDITHTTRASAHQRYIVREGAVEKLSDPATMQRYIDDEMKVDASRHGSNHGEKFSFGTTGLTMEDMCEVWDLAEIHARGKKTPVIQHRMIVELPHEATPLDRIAIMRAFTAPLEEGNIPYWVSIHAPTPDNDERNFHAHVIFLNRPARKIPWPEGGDRGAGNKPDVLTWDFACVTAKRDKHRKLRERYLHRQDVPTLLRGTWYKQWRHRYAAIVNEQMEKSGKAVRFDPRSYKDAGLVDIVPEKKSGYARKTAERPEPTLYDILFEMAGDAFVRAEAELEDERKKLAKAKAAVKSSDSSLVKVVLEHGIVSLRDPLSKRQRALQLPSRQQASQYLIAQEALIDRQVAYVAEKLLLEALADSMRPEALTMSRRRIEAAMASRTPDTRERSRKALQELPDDEAADGGRRAITEILVHGASAHERQMEDARAAVAATRQAWRASLDTSAVDMLTPDQAQVREAPLVTQKPAETPPIKVPGAGSPLPIMFEGPAPEETIRARRDERNSGQEKRRAGILATLKAKARRGSDFGL